MPAIIPAALVGASASAAVPSVAAVSARAPVALEGALRVDAADVARAAWLGVAAVASGARGRARHGRRSGGESIARTLLCGGEAAQREQESSDQETVRGGHGGCDANEAPVGAVRKKRRWVRCKRSAADGSGRRGFIRSVCFFVASVLISHHRKRGANDYFCRVWHRESAGREETGYREARVLRV